MMRYVICVFALLAYTGCPLDEDSDPALQATSAAGASGANVRNSERAALGGSAAIQQLVQDATKDRFPPPPPLSHLCELKTGETTYDDAKKLLARPDKQAKYPGAQPQSESQDATMAGLSYRFSRPAETMVKGDTDARPADSVSLILRFSWSDGAPGTGTLIFGIGGSPEDFIAGYVLKDMSITGQLYPACWPHEEE